MKPDFWQAYSCIHIIHLGKCAFHFKKKRKEVCGQVWWPILRICALHLTHPSAHTQQWVVNKHTPWTHTRCSQCCGTRGAVGGSVPCSRVSPQSWYWERWTFTPPTYNPCWIWDSNPRPLGYKFDSLSFRPRLPHFNCICRGCCRGAESEYFLNMQICNFMRVQSKTFAHSSISNIIFQCEISLTLFTFLRDVFQSLLTIQSVCLVDGRFTFKFGTSDAMHWSWSNSSSHASLCFWTVYVALATAITSSSDRCLQVEDQFTTGKFPLFPWYVCGCLHFFGHLDDQARTITQFLITQF